MNNYLKVLALSSSVLGAIGITAINPTTNQQNENLGNIYQNIEKMQNSVPKLSRINYRLEVSPVADENVKFIGVNEDNAEAELDNQQTINYLSTTLEQTNAEYEQLRQALIVAIQDTMDNLEQYRNGETELTNEQKIHIKEHANSIKYLAETLEDLSEDVICCIDGCEDCDNETEFNELTSTYISAIEKLESRIYALQNSLNSIYLINGIANPNFYSRYNYSPNHFIHGFHYDNSDNNSFDNINSNNQDVEQSDLLDNVADSEEQQDTSNTLPTQPTDDNVDNADNTTMDVDNNTNSNENNEDDKPTTFGLTPNIDTYAPTKRNIDTFYNTARANNEYNMYGGGYAPYGYGYGMPYGNYGNPYGGLNSNIINREVLDNQQQLAPTSTSAEIQNNTSEKSDDDVKPKKIRVKRAKNIDTYTGATVQSNVNTMGESKISRFFKKKFTDINNKIKERKNKKSDNYNQQFENTNQTEYVDENIISNIENSINKDSGAETDIESNNALSNTNALQSDTIPDLELHENHQPNMR